MHKGSLKTKTVDCTFTWPAKTSESFGHEIRDMLRGKKESLHKCNREYPHEGYRHHCECGASSSAAFHDPVWQERLPKVTQEEVFEIFYRDFKQMGMVTTLFSSLIYFGILMPVYDHQNAFQKAHDLPRTFGLIPFTPLPWLPIWALVLWFILFQAILIGFTYVWWYNDQPRGVEFNYPNLLVDRWVVGRNIILAATPPIGWILGCILLYRHLTSSDENPLSRDVIALQNEYKRLLGLPKSHRTLPEVKEALDDVRKGISVAAFGGERISQQASKIIATNVQDRIADVGERIKFFYETTEEQYQLYHGERQRQIEAKKQDMK